MILNMSKYNACNQVKSSPISDLRRVRHLPLHLSVYYTKCRCLRVFFDVDVVLVTRNSSARLNVHQRSNALRGEGRGERQRSMFVGATSSAGDLVGRCDLLGGPSVGVWAVGIRSVWVKTSGSFLGEGAQHPNDWSIFIYFQGFWDAH